MKKIIISILTLLILTGGLSLLVRLYTYSSSDIVENGENVSFIDGQQIITITAKGGYFPRVTAAKANMPTVIKFVTNGTFDCSSALTIPSLRYRTNLAPSGVTEVNIPSQPVGGKIQGLCSMGMYNFLINFN